MAGRATSSRNKYAAVGDFEDHVLGRIQDGAGRLVLQAARQDGGVDHLDNLACISDGFLAIPPPARLRIPCGAGLEPKRPWTRGQMQKVEIARQAITDAIPAHSSDADILLVPGLPDYSVPDRDEALYPPSAVDLVKIAREAGVSIDFADDGNRAYVGLKAAEIWMPIVVFLNNATAAGLGVVIGDWFRTLIGGAREGETRLHVKVGKQDADGETVEWLTAHGDADDVLEALTRFLERPEKASDGDPSA